MLLAKYQPNLFYEHKSFTGQQYFENMNMNINLKSAVSLLGLHLPQWLLRVQSCRLKFLHEVLLQFLVLQLQSMTGECNRYPRGRVPCTGTFTGTILQGAWRYQSTGLEVSLERIGRYLLQSS